MYSAIVRSKVCTTFKQIYSGNYQAMIDSLGARFEYVFHGEHALGGRRVSKDSMIRWWKRVFRGLPGAAFDVREVLVKGGPWDTRIAVRCHVSGPLPDGSRYENTLFQFMTLKWGKVVSVETVENFQMLERALHVVADAGIEEALAAPITD